MISFSKAFEKFYFNFYISTVRFDQRKLGMLGFFSRDKIENCQAKVEKQGLITQIHKANPSDPAGEWLLYFSKSSDIVRKAIKLHHSKDSNWIKKNRELGQLYGYPKCCINFFINLTERREFDYLKKTLANSHSTRFPSLTNRFALNPFIFHVPCSFNCKDTIRLTRNYIKLARKISPLITEQILKNLKAVVLITTDSALNISDYKLVKKTIIFKEQDLRKALLEEERIRQYIYKLTLNKKNFDLYFSTRVINRTKEDKWKKILTRFEKGGKYRVPLRNFKELKVIMFI